MATAHQLNHAPGPTPLGDVLLEQSILLFSQLLSFLKVNSVLLISELRDLEQRFILLFVVLHRLDTVDLDQLACVLKC